MPKRKYKTKKAPKFVHIDANGWEGLYVDGKLVDQGHPGDIDIFGILKKHGVPIASEFAYLAYEYQETGILPENLKDVKVD